MVGNYVPGAAAFKKSFGARVQAASSRCVIEDFREFCAQPPHRRALLSYLVQPLMPPRQFRDRVMFSNRGIAQEIPRALNELGFAVDVVDHTNTWFLPRKKYDLFIGHEGINFEQIARALAPDTAIVYLATTLEWQEANRRERLRLADIKRRRGYSLGGRIELSHESAKELAEAVICIGVRAAWSFEGYRNVMAVDNAAFPVSWSGWQSKDYRTGRSSFLFFSGGGIVRKGLDLVLEAFADTELDVYICAGIAPDFARAYARELTGYPNIHVENWIPMRSPRFEHLVSKCDWIIFPSCSEGHPGSVIECMAHGLLPIVSEGANIELPRGGIEIERLDAEAVRSAALRASQMDPEEIRSAAECLVYEARTKYSPERFRADFKDATARALANRCGISPR
jgi:glycosyltransferase involved in cell wall biosynthesis